MATPSPATYNERLFSSGIRGRLHHARFHALQRMLARRALVPRRVIELGCYDAKTLQFLPALPARYLGLDANWEGGLDIARERWGSHAAFSFVECSAPATIPGESGFDLAVSMETLEHLPPEMLDDFLAALAARTEGHAFFSVPNEKGLMFAAKYLAKRLVIGDAPSYTFAEFVAAVRGDMRKVPRAEHKGFDYQALIATVAKHFDVLEVAAIPFHRGPLWLGFGIAIFCRSRAR